MKIGIFDSGIGGLTLARTYLSDPTATIFYVADTANMPYGIKSPDHIQQISSTIVRFLEQQDVDFIIIACHTASILAGQTLKKTFSHVPLITMQDTIVPHAIAATKNDSIGIIATPATIGSNVYREALLAHNEKMRILKQACPTLAPSIEQYYDRPEILRHIIDIYLHRILATQIDTLILGCTHYALIKDIIRSYAPGVTLISSDETLAQIKIQQSFHTSNIQKNHQFFVSSDQDSFVKKLEFFLNCWNLKNINYTINPTPWKLIPSVNTLTEAPQSRKAL